MERLREQWEEANTRAAGRRDSLEDMLLEVRQYEEMSAEVDWWLAQVEEDVDAQRKVTARTAETLEKQQNEHKVSRKQISWLQAYL